MESKQVGTVYLVGAGPGDPGLITWRGLELLARADAVCVDALVDPTLVATLPAHVERHYVGKHAGYHTVSQRNIEELLIQLAKEGKNVVRLKGGDPFVFGRGGEEAQALRKAGVPFVVVPGVTAAVAASAYAGIPITHRCSSCFAVLLTAHEKPDKDETDACVPWETLAKLRGGTFAGYMGVRRLANVVENMIGNGADPATPAALIERGTTGAQNVVRAALKDLPDAVEKAGLKPPALFVIGEVVDLAEEIGWFDPGPLGGRRVMVTRPADQAGYMYEKLRLLGATVIPAPTIRTKGVFVDASWKRLFDHESKGGWLVFTSENGVRYFLAGLIKAGRDLRWLGNFQIATIGSGTWAALSHYGMRPDFVPSRATTATLADELPKRLQKGERVIRVRGNLGDTKVEAALADAGAEVQAVHVYETSTTPLEDIVRSWVGSNVPDAITFTSGSTFTSFLEQWGEEDAKRMLEDTAIVSIGPFTSSIIRDHGYEVAVEADPHDVDGLIESLRKHYAG